jgi:hypothetical protein
VLSRPPVRASTGFSNSHKQNDLAGQPKQGAASPVAERGTKRSETFAAKSGNRSDGTARAQLAINLGRAPWLGGRSGRQPNPGRRRGFGQLATGQMRARSPS